MTTHKLVRKIKKNEISIEIEYFNNGVETVKGEIRDEDKMPLMNPHLALILCQIAEQKKKNPQ